MFHGDNTMKQETKQQVRQTVANFRLPRYQEIPNMGLYLEQATKYVCEYLEPLGDYTLTPSMISNYVKKGLIANPIKKQYDLNSSLGEMLSNPTAAAVLGQVMAAFGGASVALYLIPDGAMSVALAIVLAVAPRVIPWLRKLKFGQTI